jgi:L-iditol 2-dehydrogenase
MRVAAIQADGQVRVEGREVPKIGPDEILLQVKACGLCGTDILKVKKRSVPAGTVLGHEIAGVVAEAGREINGFKKGDRVVVAHHVPCYKCHFCRHKNYSMCPSFRQTNLDPGGFSEYLRIPAEHVANTTLKIPDSLTFEEASFAEPIACCLRAIHRSELLPGDSVLVIGLGSIGLTLVQLLKHFRMEVLATDLLEDRKKMAQKFGARVVSPAPAEKHEGRGFDMLLLTAGNFDLLAASVSWVRSGGKIHLFASLEPTGNRLDLNEVYHRELSILASYSSAPEDLKEALDLLSQRKVDVRSLITLRSPLEQIPEAIQRTESKEILKAIVTP